MRPSFLLLPLALAACSTGQPGIEVRQVRVPVPQPCLPLAQIPPEPSRVGDTLTGDAASDLVIVASSSLLLRAWGREMHAALIACAAE